MISNLLQESKIYGELLKNEIELFVPAQVKIENDFQPKQMSKALESTLTQPYFGPKAFPICFVLYPSSLKKGLN